MINELSISLLQRIIVNDNTDKLPPFIKKAPLQFPLFMIENAIIREPVILKESNINGLSFYNCKFEQGLRFEASEEFKTNLIATQCEFETISFSSGDFPYLISIVGGKVTNSVSFTGGSYKRIDLNLNCKSLEVRNCKIEWLIINGSDKKEIEIESLKIQAYNFKGSLFLSYINVDKIEIGGFLRKDSEIFIKNSKARELSILDFINEGKLRIFSLSTNHTTPSHSRKKNTYSSRVLITNSHLGNSEVFNVDFRNFSDVIIRNSLLTLSSFINVTWPSNILTDLPDSKASSTANEEKREIYKQIKYALSKHGDTVGEQQFHGLEMNAYNKTLEWDKDFWTKLVLWFSHLTSNYGQSLLRPILSLIALNGLLFLLLFLSKGTPFNSYDLSKLNNYINTIAEFLRISNPIHKNEIELNSLSFILDTLIRVTSSYCIYNIIRASRRFVK